MIHERRVFQVANVPCAEELAEKLTEMTWTLCAGFRWAGLVFLNDSFSEDGAQEYAVFRESDGRQIESVTFGWCNRDRALEILRELESDGGIDLKATLPRIEASGGHRCRLCA